MTPVTPAPESTSRLFCPLCNSSYRDQYSYKRHLLQVKHSKSRAKFGYNNSHPDPPHELVSIPRPDPSSTEMYNPEQPAIYQHSAQATSQIPLQIAPQVMAQSTSQIMPQSTTQIMPQSTPQPMPQSIPQPMPSTMTPEQMWAVIQQFCPNMIGQANASQQHLNPPQIQIPNYAATPAFVPFNSIQNNQPPSDFNPPLLTEQSIAYQHMPPIIPLEQVEDTIFGGLGDQIPANQPGTTIDAQNKTAEIGQFDPLKQLSHNTQSQGSITQFDTPPIPPRPIYNPFENTIDKPADILQDIGLESNFYKDLTQNTAEKPVTAGAVLVKLVSGHFSNRNSSINCSSRSDGKIASAARRKCEIEKKQREFDEREFCIQKKKEETRALELKQPATKKKANGNMGELPAPSKKIRIDTKLKKKLIKTIPSSTIEIRRRSDENPSEEPMPAKNTEGIESTDKIVASASASGYDVGGILKQYTGLDLGGLLSPIAQEQPLTPSHSPIDPAFMTQNMGMQYFDESNDALYDLLTSEANEWANEHKETMRYERENHNNPHDKALEPLVNQTQVTIPQPEFRKPQDTISQMEVTKPQDTMPQPEFNKPQDTVLQTEVTGPKATMAKRDESIQVKVTHRIPSRKLCAGFKGPSTMDVVFLCNGCDYKKMFPSNIDPESQAEIYYLSGPCEACRKHPNIPKSISDIQTKISDIKFI